MITPLYAGFVDRYGDQIAPEHRVVCERLVAAFDGYLAQEAQAAGSSGQGRIQGLVHGLHQQRQRTRPGAVRHHQTDPFAVQIGARQRGDDEVSNLL